jgi:hypothetical protein
MAQIRAIRASQMTRFSDGVSIIRLPHYLTFPTTIVPTATDPTTTDPTTTGAQRSRDQRERSLPLRQRPPRLAFQIDQLLRRRIDELLLLGQFFQTGRTEQSRLFQLQPGAHDFEPMFFLS